MRWAFGIGGMLVTVMVMVIIIKDLWVPDVQESLHARNYAENTIGPMTGKEPDTGLKIQDTYGLYADVRNDGKLQDFQVTKVNPGSWVQTHYGLMANDVIVGLIDTHGVSTPMNGDDPETAKQEVLETLMDQAQVVVLRGNQQFTLPAAPVQVQTSRQPPAQAQQNQPSRQGQSEGGENDTMKAINQRLHPIGMN